MCQMVKGYLTEIETLRAKLVESEAIVVQLRKDMSRVSKIKVSPRTDNSSLSESGIEEVLDIAKRDVEKDLESIKASKHSAQGSDLSGSESGKLYFILFVFSCFFYSVFYFLITIRSGDPPRAHLTFISG